MLMRSWYALDERAGACNVPYAPGPTLEISSDDVDNSDSTPGAI